MSETTIGKIKKLYDQGGMKAVRVVKNSRPKGTGRFLSSEQKKQIQKLLTRQDA